MKHLIKIILLSVLACHNRAADAQQVDSLPPGKELSSAPVHLYQKPRPFDFVKHVPLDVWGVTKSPFQKDGWKGFLAVAASSAILIH